MPADEAEFQKKITEARKRANRVDELRIAVLRGHMIVEEGVEEFLEVALFNPTYMKVQEMTFRRKVELVLSLSFGRDKDEFWPVVWALNQLRNKVAHEQDPKEVEEKMKYLRGVFLKALSPAQARDMEKRTDKEIVEEASYLCAGLFGMLGLDARERRSLVEEHWESRSG
jgi:hypothetical protein